MRVVGADGVADLERGERAARALQATHHAPRKRGGPASFVIDDVAAFVRDDLVARLGVGPDGDLIGHRAAGDKAGGLLARERGEAVLEFLHGGIIA